MEELQVIETTSGRQFKPWATKDDVQDPASVTAIASEIASGKQAIASAINAKGGSASATESFSELAQDIQSMQIQEITIDGGDMYAKQLYGVANNDITPGYWNLYQVMADLLSDARFSNYGGFLLAEYFKGYDSIALSGAGAGGAYVVSDMENGLFKMYTNDTTHTWATDFDGKGNRWVAYCFADEYHDFDITDTNTSPRSIFIGRKVGTIKCLVNARTSKIVVPDGNELRRYICNGYTQNFDTNIVLKNIINASGSVNKSSDSVYVDSKQYPTGAVVNVPNGQFGSIIIKTPKDEIVTVGQNVPLCNFAGANIVSGDIKLLVLQLPDVMYLPQFAKIVKSGKIEEAHIYAKEWDFTRGDIFFYCNVKKLYIHGLEKSVGVYGQDLLNSSSAPYIWIGYSDNDKNKSVSMTTAYSETAPTDVELQDGYCKPLNISGLTSSLIEENMYAHILQKLKQDVVDCGDGITITLGATNLAKLTSAESVQLLDDLTNIYGYTFA